MRNDTRPIFAGREAEWRRVEVDNFTFTKRLGYFERDKWDTANPTVREYLVSNTRRPSRARPLSWLFAATTYKCAIHVWFVDEDTAVSHGLNPHPSMFAEKGFQYFRDLMRLAGHTSPDELDALCSDKWLAMQAELYKAFTVPLSPQQADNLKKCLDKCEKTLKKHGLGRPKGDAE